MTGASPRGRHWLARLSFRVYLLILLALAACGVAGLVQGRPLVTALAIGVIAADYAGTRLAICALVVCVLLHAYLLLALGGAALLCHGLALLGERLRRARFDPAGLAAAVAQLSEPLFATLRTAAGPSPITTRELVVAARARPRWARIRLEGSDPGVGAFDGPLLDDGRGGRCSQYLAEAVAFAKLLAALLEHPLDVELLATSAVVLPLTAASQWVTDGCGFTEADLQVQPDTLVRVLGEFTRFPAGADALRRVELVTTLSKTLGDSVSRERLASLSRGGMGRMRLLFGGATVAAYVAVLGSLLWSVVRWTVLLPVRIPRALVRTLRRIVRPSKTRAPEAEPQRQTKDTTTARAGVARAPVKRRSLLAPWQDWPHDARALWLFARPALAVGAIIAAAFVDHAGWLGCVAVGAAAAVRPLRLRALALLAAAAVAPLAVAGCALLGARVALGELALWRLGRVAGSERGARRRGLLRVLAARLEVARRMIGPLTLTLESAKARFVAAVSDGDDFKTIDRAAEYGAAAWAEADTAEMWRTLRIAVRGGLFGQWAGSAGHTSAMGELRRIAMLDTVAEWVVRAGLLLLAAGSAAVLFPHDPPLLNGGPLLGRLTAAAATLALAVPLSARRRPGLGGGVAGGANLSLAFWGAIAWWLMGADVLRAAGVAVVAASIVQLLRRQADGLAMAGRARWREWPVPKATPMRLRRHWRAAAQAVEAGREPIGIDMLRTLADMPGASDELVATALGRVALLEVERGQLESAAATLDRISWQFERLPAAAAVAAGMLSASLGDLERAEHLLEEAMELLDERSPLVPRAALSLADALARRGRTDDAIALLARQRARPLAIQGVDAILDGETAIAAALAGKGERPAACERLDEALKYLVIDDLRSWQLERRSIARLEHAEARALLLRGRLALELGAGTEAGPLLRRAVELLASSSDGALRATARVLLGAALVSSRDERDTAVESIRAGIEELELRRTRLRAGDRRTAMIVADEQLYERALRSLAYAAGLGVAEAAPIAATLIESLRRSAIAAALRAGPLPLDDEALALVEQIDANEGLGSPVEDLRAELSAKVSSRFAAAYLPTVATLDRLRKIARGYGHVLAYYVSPGGSTGWRAWIAPAGAITVDAIRLGGSAAAMLDEARSGVGFGGRSIHVPLEDCTETWTALGEALLPAELRRLVAAAEKDRPERLLVVPDGLLSFVPWAALDVAGEPLVERAVIQVTPSLELAAEAGARRPRATERVVVHLDRDSDELRLLSQRCSVARTDTRERFVAALRSRFFGGAYMAMHGRETGIRQHVAFADGTVLSAATALACPWPAWTVFASCLVGRVEQVAGQEPLGLAISCMMGGADTVVASVVEITDEGASTVCGALAARLTGRCHPAEALRDAQRAYLRDHDFATVASCLGLTCISTLPAPRPLGEATRPHRNNPEICA